MSNPASGQQNNLSNSHVASRMRTAGEVQDYIDLLLSPVTVRNCGELYVGRQLEWAVVELDRVGGSV